MKAIIRVNKTSKGVDINHSSIYNSELGMSGNVLIRHLTDSGYESKKPLYDKRFSLDMVKTSNSGMYYIELTDEQYEDMINEYINIIPKIYIPPHYTPPSAAHVIANFITKNGTDPYDRG